MYVIVSPRIGNPGDLYEPQDGINVNALIEAGLISTDKPAKSSKVKKDQTEE